MTADASPSLPAPRAWGVLLAAGNGRRMADATGGVAKQFLTWRGAPLFWHSARAMSRSAAVAGLVFVFPPDALDACRALLDRLHAREDLGLPWLSVAGGALRQDSVRLGLAALPPGVTHVLVHDAARPFAGPALIRRTAQALNQGAPGVVPALPVTDTIKEVDGCRVAATLRRERLMAVQTPQGFVLDILRDAHRRARDAGRAATDDAALLEALGHEVRVIPGEPANVKITTPEDLRLLEGPAPAPEPRTGMGYDVHRYGPGRPMRLGGVALPHAPEVIAHSDGDVLLHALADAILGCACLGDLGRHFPDNDPRLDNISSAVLLAQVLDMAREARVTVRHADLTVVAQAPKLAPYRDEIRNNVARLLGLPPGNVNVKATTEERLGFTGRGEGIKAYAVVTALHTPSPQGGAES